MNAREAEKALMTLALGDYKIPGDAGFPAGMGFEAPRDRGEAEVLRGYIGQVRQELASRLLGRVYGGGEVPSKVCYSEMGGCWCGFCMVGDIANGACSGG